jgi:soluble lytic murein transglycosylase
MTVLRKKYVWMLLLLIIVAVSFYKTTWVGKMMYPIHYKQEIEVNAAKFGIDPLLIAAIIRVESNYKSGLVSKKGAVGLMQIMPDTAEWIIKMDGFSSLTLQSLHEPGPNIVIGVKYVDLLNHQFNNNLAKVLAAYNAGPGNVSKWLDSGLWNGDLDSIDQINFWETRKYVDKVIYYYKQYQETYH